MSSITRLLQQATLALLASSDTAKLDAELLLAHALQQPRTYLYTWPEQSVNPEQIHAFLSLVDKRIAGQPIAYLLGNREFWSLSLEVNPKVLIPRPETELLVETALSLPLSEQAIIADLGTGSGAIALSLSVERPEWEIYATDYASAALEVAELNAKRLDLGTIHFLQGSWCQALPALLFDAIISNPPYIDKEDPHLHEGDVRFEPRSALVADNKGLSDLDCIIKQARGYLKPGGYLLLEHGYNQAQAVVEIFADYGYQAIENRKDLAGVERVSLARIVALP
ncbi:MAG: peptide chain release factor N(5)-glutamine methyltransferase [Gammaproteobacteria bacterium]|nr:peptide chain release factor N(5)-glutamine methyltransferase [Gammaproteobacteria bacterium]